jgi:putative ABC transport system permease protein
MTALFHDFRFGLRLLLKRPGFTAIALLTLALGIGANTAIFSVVNGVLLGAVPFEDPEELAWIGEHSEQIPNMSVSYPNFVDWRERNRSFEAIAAHRYEDFNLTGLDRPELVLAVEASATLMPLLGVEPLLGRNFTAEEDQPGSPRVVVLSHALWQRRFGGDEGVLGRSITLDGDPYEVIGVMPEGFVYPLFTRRVEMWLPIGHFAEGWLERRGNHPGIYVTARTLPGVDLGQARADMDRIGAELAAEYPDSNAKHGVSFTTVQERMVRNTRPALLVLGGAVLLVLLIACVNVANLLLARGAARYQEMAVRAALGAGRWQVVRQLLAESLLLAVAGGAAGVAVAWVGVRLLLANLDPESLPVTGAIGIDGTVLFFALGVSIATGLLFGLAPALQAVRRDFVDALKEGSKGSEGPGRQRVRRALVVAEIALALVVLVGAVLFLRSFERLTAADPGFDPEDVLTFEVTLPESTYEEDARQIAFFDQLRERLEGLPGVRSAATTLPLLGGWQNTVIAEGMAAPAPGDQISSDVLRVSPGYFETLGVSIHRGRPIDDRDRADTVPVAVVDQTFAERMWPGEDPLGKRVKFGSDPADDEDPWMTVVGVAEHVKSYGVDQDSRIEIYVPARQNPIPFATVALETGVEPRTLVPLIEREVQALDPDLPIANVRTLEELVAQAMVAERVSATLLGVFAGLALLLATVGIYGVMAYSVNQRHREIGIRMALGAAGEDVRRLVVGQGLRLALFGIVVGLALALLAAPLLASQLYGVDARDPWTYLLLPLVVALVTLGACLGPASRASRTQPVTALRYE